MKREVIWSTRARTELLEILDYIASANAMAAERAYDRLTRTAEALGEIPSGRPARVDGAYEKSVAGLPYVIAYEISRPASGPERIEILHVIHTASNWPAGGWPPD